MVKDSKRKRSLPHNLVERQDDEIIEKIFGKKVKQELDKITGKPEMVESKELAKHLKT